MAPLTARPATDADLAALVALYEEAVVEVSGHRGGKALVGTAGRQGPVEPSFVSHLTAPEQFVVVAVGSPRPQGEDVVGYGTCRARAMTTGEVLGVIEELYVRPAHRRQGLGSAMADLLVAWCREKNCVGVDAWALPGSRTVKSFYESRRFTARALIMHHPV